MLDIIQEVGDSSVDKIEMISTLIYVFSLVEN